MIHLSASSTLTPEIKKVLNEISLRGIDGTVVPLVVDYKNQRVGVGTSSPDRLLDVSGNCRIQGRLDFAAGFVLGMLSAGNLDVPGTGSFNRLSALTATIKDLDILGNLVFPSSNHGTILTSPNGTQWILTVANDGAVTSTPI